LGTIQQSLQKQMIGNGTYFFGSENPITCLKGFTPRIGTSFIIVYYANLLFYDFDKQKK
jgi:hypothetical protein